MTDNVTEKPESLLERVAKIKPLADFYDHTYISLRDKYLFHTVGKAANSTVKHVFYTLEMKERRRKLPSVHDRASSPLMSPYQLNEELLGSVLQDPEVTRFTFVRDPYSRLLSCFLDRIADAKSRPHAQFVRAMGKPLNYKPSFAEFIETICAQKPYDQNNHWRVQVDDAMVDVIDYDFIGKQESFDQDMDRLMARITGSKEEGVVGEVNASPSKTGSTSRLEQYWTPELARLVQDAYARDFSHFGYDSEPAWIAKIRAPAARTPKKAPQPPAPTVRRSIRLKEFGANAHRVLTPTEQYLRQTNGTIAADEFLLQTDADGFIVAPEFRDRTGPRTYVLGDSFVECSFVQQGMRLCDRMNEHEKIGDGLVLNGGYSGSTTLHALYSLLAKVAPYKPEHVIYALPSNDVLSLMQPGGFWNLADKRYTPIVPVRPTPSGSDNFEANAACLAPLLEQFCAAAKGFDFKLTLATMPFVSSQYEDLGWFRIRHVSDDVYQALMAKRRHLNAIVREVAADWSVPLLELETRLSPEYFYDDVHLNARGCEVMAQVVVDAITD